MDNNFQTGVVQILDSSGNVAGTGFIVSADGVVATCSHVIQLVDSQKRNEPLPDEIVVVLPLNNGKRFAHLLPQSWRPWNKGDIAFLKLEGDLPKSVHPITLGATVNISDHPIQTFGYPTVGEVEGLTGSGAILGETKEAGQRLLQISSSEITQGFSGAPIWDKTYRYAIGMVVSIASEDVHGRLNDIAFGVPSETLVDACPQLHLAKPPSRRNWKLAYSLSAFCILLIAASLGWYWWSIPTKMTGGFRIAVAGFTVIGPSSNSSVGKEFAQDVYLALDQTSNKLIEELSPGFKVTIWGPERTSQISDQDAVVRAKLAQQMAEKIDAEIVIYGVVDTTSPTWTVTPEFYLSSANFKNSYEIEEITGEYQLGDPIMLVGQDNLSRRIELTSKFSPRIQALSKISFGLAYYFIRDYAKAISLFQAADKLSDWQAKQGKQVLYLLLANSALKKSDLEMASRYYIKSLEIDPMYSRSYVGLGSTQYLLALKPFEISKKPEDTDNGLLDLAIENYLFALKATNRPTLADIETKVHFGLGQTYFMRTYAGKTKDFNQAVTEFSLVVRDYNNGANPRVREITAESHARLGLILDLTSSSDKLPAIQEYEASASLLYDNPERQSLYKTRADSLRKRMQTSAP